MWLSARERKFFASYSSAKSSPRAGGGQVSNNLAAGDSSRCWASDVAAPSEMATGVKATRRGKGRGGGGGQVSNNVAAAGGPARCSASEVAVAPSDAAKGANLTRRGNRRGGIGAASGAGASGLGRATREPGFVVRSWPAAEGRRRNIASMVALHTARLTLSRRCASRRGPPPSSKPLLASAATSSKKEAGSVAAAAAASMRGVADLTTMQAVVTAVFARPITTEESQALRTGVYDLRERQGAGAAVRWRGGHDLVELERAEIVGEVDDGVGEVHVEAVGPGW